MRTYAIDQRTSDIFSTSAEDDLLVNPLSPSPVHLVINGLDGRDTLVFPGERNGYRDLSITMDDDGATRISGTEASGFFFGFATQFKYFDITLTNFESIRFTQADGTFDIGQMRIHSYRHQFADLVISSGRSLYDVQVSLGHSDPRVSQRYARLSMHTLKEAANTASLLMPKLKSDTPLPSGVVVPFQKVA